MEVSKLTQISVAAKQTGTPKTTLFSAIDREEIPVYHTVCKLPLVVLADVQKWAKKKRPLGRPRKD